jgi:hypothetical protein
MSNNLFLDNSILKKTIPNIAIFEFEYPYVYITFNHENIVDDNNLDIFFQTWLDIYNEKKPYIIVFDGTMVNYTKPSFIFKFAKFMKKLRKQEPQYLQYSIIIIDNSLMRGIMNMVFRIQKPVAPVYMCKTAEELLDLHNKIHKNSAISIAIEERAVNEDEIKKIYFDNNYTEEIV